MLPKLHQATLDAPTLDSLFRDLASCADILSVVPKMTTGQVAEGSVALEIAHEGLRNGEFYAVQIRYRHDGKEWCDTLMRMPDEALRLVRICTDEALASAAGD